MMEMMLACLASFILGAVVTWISQAINARQFRKQLEMQIKRTEAKVETKKKETTKE